jgi:hypothetical protein
VESKRVAADGGRQSSLTPKRSMNPEMRNTIDMIKAARNEMLRRHGLPCEKRVHSFLEFSLCLSRACLGKMMIILYINGIAKSGVVRTVNPL